MSARNWIGVVLVVACAIAYFAGLVRCFGWREAFAAIGVIVGVVVFSLLIAWCFQ